MKTFGQSLLVVLEQLALAEATALIQLLAEKISPTVAPSPAPTA